jgi:chromosomal replication initiator protein
VARPRQVAMYLAKNFTVESLPKIGEKFGKNHATVIHSVKIVQDLMLSDAHFAREVKELEEKVR